MALKKSYITIFILSLLFIACFGCSRKISHDKLIEYIQAEKALRSRIGEVRGIEDSVQVLSKEYGINLTESFIDLVDHPEAWVEIIKALKDEK